MGGGSSRATMSSSHRSGHGITFTTDGARDITAVITEGITTTKNKQKNKSLLSSELQSEHFHSFDNDNNNNICSDDNVDDDDEKTVSDVEGDDSDTDSISCVFPPMYIINKIINSLLPASTIEILARHLKCYEHLLPDPEQLYGGQADISLIRCKLYNHYDVDGGKKLLVNDLISIGYYPLSCTEEEDDNDTKEEEGCDDSDDVDAVSQQVSQHNSYSNSTNINPTVQDPLPSQSNHDVFMPTPNPNANSTKESISPTNVIDFPSSNNNEHNDGKSNIEDDNDKDIGDAADFSNDDTFGTSQNSTEELDDDCGRRSEVDDGKLHRPSPKKRHNSRRCELYFMLFCLFFYYYHITNTLTHIHSIS